MPSASVTTLHSRRIHMGQEHDETAVDHPEEEVPSPPEKAADALPRPKQLMGGTYRIETPLGKAYVTVNCSEEGKPFEVFVNLGKAGSDLAADAEAIGRLISLVLRLPDPIPADKRLLMVVEELQGIGGSRTHPVGDDQVRSLPDGVAAALRRDLHARAAS
jgi:ribonucleoside-diphosphate reductase alpha chain